MEVLANAESCDSTGGRTLADGTYTDGHMEVGMEVEVEVKVEAEVGGVKPSFKSDVVEGGNLFPHEDGIREMVRVREAGRISRGNQP
jgi:hypothetical protein